MKEVARLFVPDKVVDRCLRLLEMWQEDNPNQFIEVTMNEDGTIKMRRSMKQDCYTYKDLGSGVFEKIFMDGTEGEDDDRAGEFET